MLEPEGTKMNFAALNRVDSHAKRIIDSAIHVALYSFADDDWRNSSIEGTLYVYSRTVEPDHYIFIMNRLSMTNWAEPVTADLHLQIQKPFLLYKNYEGKIHGLWFYNTADFDRISSLLVELINNDIDSKTRPGGRGGFNNQVDICSVLSKTVEEDWAKSSIKKVDLSSFGLPLDMNLNVKDGNSNEQLNPSVLDFFAKASNDKKLSNGHEIHSNSVCSKMSSPIFNQSVPMVIPPSQDNVKPPMHHPMYHPAHCVEFIEKQQRACTPQEDMFKGLDLKKMLISGSDRNELVRRNVEYHSSDSIQKPHGMDAFSVSDSSPQPVFSKHFLNAEFNPSPFAFNGNSTSHYEHQRPLSAPLGRAMQPTLMPPMLFQSSLNKDKASVINMPSSSLNVASGSSVVPDPSTKSKISEAIMYLLNNDDDFVDKIHQAYVKSFTKSLP